MDLTLSATPFFFGSMEYERRWLRRRAERIGPTAADYERRDTTANLLMGAGSLAAPFVARSLFRTVVPGGRHRRALLSVAGGAALATTVADRVASRRERRAARAVEGTEPVGRSGEPLAGGADPVADVARFVSAVGAPIAVIAGGVAITTGWSTRLTSERLWKHRIVGDLGEGPWAWLAAIFGWDFIYYWNHRLMHESRFMWAIHVVHHSSERYNLSVALRQPVADALGTFVPYGLLALFGVRPHLIAQARGINLIYQYWIHTDAIPKLGWFEKVANTASHHRVHHGVNPQYIDRNHGSILIVWDRLFGTFQEENEPVVYGLTKNIETFRPDRVIDHEYVDMIGDVSKASTWRDRLSFVLRGPGWAYERHAEALAAA